MSADLASDRDDLRWVKLRLHDAEARLWALRHWPDSADAYATVQAMRAYAERYFSEGYESAAPVHQTDVPSP